MACYMALVDLGPAEMASVTNLFRVHGSSLGDAGSSHGEGTARGSNAKAHLAYFNGGGNTGSRDDAMIGYYYQISKDKFPELLNWLMDGDHFKRVRNLTSSIGSLPLLTKPDSYAAVERYSKDWPNPLKVEYYARAF